MISAQQAALFGIQSTAGAIPIRNEKGELSMQKVKVQRYISGKRPEYAHEASSEDDTEDEDFIDRKTQKYYSKSEEHGNRDRESVTQEQFLNDYASHTDDPRLRRLARNFRDDISMSREQDYNRSEERSERHRHIHQPEFIESDIEDELRKEHRNITLEKINNNDVDEVNDNDDDHEMNDTDNVTADAKHRRIAFCSDSDGSDTELSDSENEKRRQKIRQKTLTQRKEEETLPLEDEKQSESSDSESSEYEEESGSEEENEPRLKPLFVRKRDRATIAEKEKEVAKQRQLEHEAKRQAKDRRRQTLRLVEESIKKDLEKAKPESGEASINDVCTDDENDEVEYEAWKLRELKRIKRDREERELLEKERLDIDHLRNMTEDERRQELRMNPKQITNKSTKGKYKFLQKYYHRGAFYLDAEDDVYKRDFAQATLEDHFDKTVLPKVMQVKNFGRCGRTKYTHLVDQDTTQFDSPWYTDTTNNIKFHNEKAGGMKQVFERPGLSKRKKNIN